MPWQSLRPLSSHISTTLGWQTGVVDVHGVANDGNVPQIVIQDKRRYIFGHCKIVMALVVRRFAVISQILLQLTMSLHFNPKTGANSGSPKRKRELPSPAQVPYDVLSPISPARTTDTSVQL